MIILFFIISFLLDGIVFSLSSLNSVAFPLFSLLSLLIAYPYYSRNIKNFYMSAILIGIVYDIVYTNSLFLNTLLFLVMAYIINLMFKYLTNNFLNTFLISTIIICLYRLFNYLFYIVIGVINWNLNDLIMSISFSLIINYIYIALFYFLLYIFSKKRGIKRKI